MDENLEEDFIKLYVEYQEKREFIFIPAESEIFQLKMMICAKFRLYEYNKLTIINKGNIISNYDDRVRINEFLIPENDYVKEYELLVIYNTEKKNNQTEASLNNSILADKNLNESSNNILNNSENKSNNNLNNKRSFLNESNVKYFVVCGCSEGNEALNICLKCNCFLCRNCMRQEPHLLHQSEIIKISKCYEHMKNFLTEQTNKINDNFIYEENWIYLQNFDNFFSEFKNKIERNYNNVLNLLEDMKASEIDYLIYFREKVKIDEKITELNNHIENLIREFQSEIGNFNDNLISRIEERLNVAEQLFKVENINKSLTNLNISKSINYVFSITYIFRNFEYLYIK